MEHTVTLNEITNLNIKQCLNIVRDIWTNVTELNKLYDNFCFTF